MIYSRRRYRYRKYRRPLRRRYYRRRRYFNSGRASSRFYASAAINRIDLLKQYLTSEDGIILAKTISKINRLFKSLKRAFRVKKNYSPEPKDGWTWSYNLQDTMKRSAEEALSMSRLAKNVKKVAKSATTFTNNNIKGLINNIVSTMNAGADGGSHDTKDAIFAAIMYTKEYNRPLIINALQASNPQGTQAAIANYKTVVESCMAHYRVQTGVEIPVVETDPAKRIRTS